MQGKLIAGLVGAAGYGALVAWAITSDYYEGRLKEKNEHIAYLHRRQATTVIDHLQTFQTEEPAPTIDDLEETGIGTSDEIEEIIAEKAPESDVGETDVTGEDEEVDEEQTNATRQHLQSLIDQYTAAPEDSSAEVVERAVVMDADKVPPFVISQEDYAWDEEGEEYEKCTVTYYPRARVLLDEDDEVIDDVAITVGWKNMNRFGDESKDADTVFIRNRRLRTDYEVVRDEDSPLPLHVKYGMPREEFEVNKAAGTLRLREEDT